MWIRKPASSARTVVSQISRIANIVAILFLLAMVLLTVLDIFLRYVFNAPIPGSVELTEYFMVVAGFLGLGWCAMAGGHLKVDMLIDRLPPRFQKITDVITIIPGITILPLVAWQGFAQAKYSHLEKTASSLLNIPAYPFYIVVGIGYALLFLVAVVLLVDSLRKAMKR